MTPLLARTLLEAGKRLLSPFLYPLAYLCRHAIRTDEVLMRHEQAATCGIVLWKPKRLKALWYLLDDSINAEGKVIYSVDIDYCAYGNRSRFVEWLPEGAFKEFARSWHWSAVRNSCINLTWLLALGDMTSEKILHGEKPRNFIALRHYKGGKSRLYIQFYPWGDMRFKIGWLSNGRFEVQFRRKKI